MNYQDVIQSIFLMKNSEKSFLNLTLFHSFFKCFSHISNFFFSLNLLNFLIVALNYLFLFKILFYNMFYLIFELLITECNHKKLKNRKKKNEFSMNFDEAAKEIQIWYYMIWKLLSEFLIREVNLYTCFADYHIMWLRSFFQNSHESSYNILTFY